MDGKFAQLIKDLFNELTDEDVNADEDEDEVNGDREEWMYLAELNTSHTQLNDENVIDISDEYWQSRSKTIQNNKLHACQHGWKIRIKVIL